MSEYEISRVLDIKARLGEAPLWCVAKQSLVWLDIHKCTINRFNPSSGDNQEWSLPSMPGCFMLREGDGAIIAAQDGIYDFDFVTGASKRICTAPFDSASYRFNDGKPDRQGRLWAGSVYLHFDLHDPKTDLGSFYRYDGNTLELGISPISVANGCAFSPDGRTIYHAETHLNLIYAWDYDPAMGTASGKRLFAEVPKELGVPDGATVDTEGGYWVALALGDTAGGIARYTPDGKMDVYFTTPVLIPTMVAFGGPDMSTLYFTSMGELDARYCTRPLGEMAGDIFAVETKFHGIPEVYHRSPK